MVGGRLAYGKDAVRFAIAGKIIAVMPHKRHVLAVRTPGLEKFVTIPYIKGSLPL